MFTATEACACACVLARSACVLEGPVDCELACTEVRACACTSALDVGDRERGPAWRVSTETCAGAGVGVRVRPSLPHSASCALAFAIKIARACAEIGVELMCERECGGAFVFGKGVDVVSGCAISSADNALAFSFSVASAAADADTLFCGDGISQII